MRLMPLSILLGATSLALAAAAGCAGDPAASGPAGAAPPMLATTLAPLDEAPDDGDEVACGEELVEPEPQTVCLTLQRGWTGSVADAATGRPDRGSDVRPGDASALTVSGGEAERQALLWFDTASIPAGAVVVSASLSLDAVTEGDAKVRVHRVLEPWREADVDVETRARFEPDAVAVLEGRARVSADLAPLVQAWLDGRAENYGVALATDDGARAFASSEAALRYVRPRLELCLKAAKGSAGSGLPDGTYDPGKPGADGPALDELASLVCAGADPLGIVQACPADADHPTAFCANTAVDELNCGGCGKACAFPDFCSKGACIDSKYADRICAADGKSVCADPKTGTTTCEDLGEDHDSCGACGTTCLPTERCDLGVCSCGSNATLCNGVCASLSVSHDNCGACGNVCGPEARCVDGTCLAPSNVALIGDLNARYFRFGEGGALSPVHSQAYKRSWTHVASTVTSKGTPALLFYSRELGTARFLAYGHDGALTELGASTTFDKTWDAVVAPRQRTDYDLLFYSRETGELKAVDARDDGSFVAIDSTTLPAPDGDDSFSDGFDPARHAWDNIVPVKNATFAPIADALFAYHQVTGRGQFFLHVQTTDGWMWLPGPKHQLSRRWDEIAAGDFDGDGFDDLVFYDQDTGKLKLMFLDPGYDAKGFQDLPDQGTSHGARLIAGNFDATATRDDFILYQTDGGDVFEHGRLRLWKDAADGSRVIGRDDGGVLDGWTHLLPVDLGDGQGRKGLLMYSNQHVIDVQYIPMSTEWLLGTWDWDAKARKTILRHEASMRKVYAPAGLAFNVTLADEPGFLKEAATYVCKTSSRDPVNDWVRANVPETTLPILLATEVSSGTGCSSPLSMFVRETYLYDYSAKTGYLLEGHSAHEMGHYFGLGHAHIAASKNAAVAYGQAFMTKKLGDDGDAITLDADARWKDGGSWDRVWDSPATLLKRYWREQGIGPEKTLADEQELQAVMCPTTTFSPVETFTNGDGAKVELVLYPPTISAYGMCPGSRGQGFARLSRDQVRVVRHALYGNRKQLIGL